MSVGWMSLKEVEQFIRPGTATEKPERPLGPEDQAQSLGAMSPGKTNKTIEDGWIRTRQPHRRDQKPAVTAQMEITGEPFHRRAGVITKGNEITPIESLWCGRRLAARDERRGLGITARVKTAPPSVVPSDFPHRSVTEARAALDLADQQRSLPTRASIRRSRLPFVDLSRGPQPTPGPELPPLGADGVGW